MKRQSENRVVLLIVALMTLLGLKSVPINAVELKASFEETTRQATFTLYWSESNVSATPIQKEGEVLLRFSESVQFPDYREIVDQATSWIEDLVVSYDTIFIKVRKDLTPETLDQTPGEFSLKLTRSAEIVHPADPSKTRLQVIKARLLFKQGKAEESIQLLSRLIEENPENVSILLIKADYSYLLGRQNEAMQLVLLAEAIDPGNPGVVTMKNRFALMERPFIRSESAQRDTCGNLGERFNRIQFEMKPSSKGTVGVKLSTYTINYNNTGSLSALENENTQAELYGSVERDSGPILSGVLFINESSVGLGGEQTWTGSDNWLTFGLDYHRPNWEYFISQVEADHKHRIRVRYQKTVNPRFSYSVFSSINQYVLTDLDPTPTSVTFQGTVSYHLPDSFLVKRWLAEYSYLIADYSLDTETPLVVEETQGVTKARFTRLTHGPKLYAGKQIGFWDYSGYLGYLFRTSGCGGGLFGGKILYEPSETLDFYFNVDWSINEVCCPVTLMTLGLKWIL